MGEEENKPEENKTEEPKTEEKKDDKKGEEPKESPSPAEAEELALPPEIVLKVYLHCEGCAKKVRRCLKGFQGVEDVETDCKMNKVVVKGEKADPMAVLERVQKKSHRHVELLSPIPKSLAEDTEKPEEKKVEKLLENKEEDQMITVVIKVQMHCEACAQEIKRRILKMSGVQEVEPDLKISQVTVKGIFDPPKLVEFVHKRTGKQVLVVNQKPHDEKEQEKGKKEKSGDAGGDKATMEEKKDGGGDVAVAEVEGGEEATKVVELKKNEFYYNYPQNYEIDPNPQRFEMQNYPQYPPQMFSDENPNACFIM